MTASMNMALSQRAESLRVRIDALTGLRSMIDLAPEHDLGPARWTAIDARLHQARDRLRTQLGEARGARTPRQINAQLGAVEVALARAYDFYDTYLDVLSQRLVPRLGAELAGCDMLAAEGLMRPHPTLTNIPLPIVYVDRGFGASILRTGARFPDATLNPTPLIQIPYSRLQAKQNLTSILHECGHEALVRLGLTGPLAALLAAVVEHGGGSSTLARHFALWSSEIAPDFWGFCLSGAAQVASLRELFSLPADMALHSSLGDPHPPPYLRVLLGIDWCRRCWGRGPWDAWEREWRAYYPYQDRAPDRRELLREAERFVPAIGRALFEARFSGLDDRPIPSYFDLAALAPRALDTVARRLARGTPVAASPAVTLAAFRRLRDAGAIEARILDRRLSSWLAGLGIRHRARQKGSNVA